MSQELIVENIGRVRRITLNAPERRNPLSFVQARNLLTALQEAAAATEVSAVILTGNGKSFCVGGDQKDFQAGFSKRPPEVLSDYPPLEIFRLARSYRKPLIAAVNGAALGGGLGITCLAHLAVASDVATFGIPEIKLGIFPLTVVPVVRPILGDRLTFELALTGRILDAQEALEHNIVNRVVPAADLQQTALDLATTVGEFSPLALRLGIEAMQESADMDFDAAVSYLNAMRTIFFGSEDLLEGATAFLEKRKPVWRGR